MSQNDASARPSQVTVAGWTVAISSVVVVLAVFQAMTQLHSLDMRAELTDVVTSGAAKDLGLTVDDAIAVVRWCLFVAGVAAAASAILGFFVLRRHHSARIGVTIAAVPVVLTSPFAGSLPGMIVGAGAALLWSRPARDWFAGRPVTRPEPRTAGTRQSAPDRTPTPPPPIAPPMAPPPDLSAPPAVQPPPTQGWGQTAPPRPFDFPPPTQPPVYAPVPLPPPPAAPRSSVERPPRVRLACIVTWVLSALTGVAALASIGVIAARSDELVDRVKESPTWDASMDESLIVPATITLAVILALWCAAAAVLALFAWRRQTWAWILLLISTGMAALVSVFAFPFSLPIIVGSALVFGLLLHRQSRAWYAGPPAPPAGPQQPQQPPRPW